MKVFGVGWAKTGTTTLGACLRTLGYRHRHARLDLVEDLPTGDLTRIMQVVDRYDSFEDWPWLLLYRELDAAYPGSRFILTERDSDRWLASYRNMVAAQGEPTERIVRIRRILYGLPFPDVSDEQLVARYEQHQRDVRAWFADRPDDLLVVDWSRGDGWEQLCGFLGHDVPDEPFPHANRGSYDTGGG